MPIGDSILYAIQNNIIFYIILLVFVFLGYKGERKISVVLLFVFISFALFQVPHTWSAISRQQEILGLNGPPPSFLILGLRTIAFHLFWCGSSYGIGRVLCLARKLFERCTNSKTKDNKQPKGLLFPVLVIFFSCVVTSLASFSYIQKTVDATTPQNVVIEAPNGKLEETGKVFEGVATNDTPSERAERIKLTHEAAGLGDAKSQYNLGLWYADGKGVKQDYVEAEKWFRKAAEQGDAEAQYNLSVIYSKGSGVLRNNVESEKWLRKFAELGLVEAQLILCAMYNVGEGAKQEYVEAEKWCRKASEQGDAKAQTLLGGMYRDAQGGGRNLIESVKWYSKAAEQGYAPAQQQMGVIYTFGFGLERDYAKAEKWFRKAAEQGDVESQLVLGSMLLEGKGLPRNYIEAYVWFSLAAAQGNEDGRKWLDTIEKKLNQEQIDEAQKRALQFVPKVSPLMMEKQH